MDQFTRRDFGRTILGGAAASTLGRRLQAQDDCAPPDGTPVDFIVPSNVQNIARKSVAELTANEVARLRLAYQKLRALSDPIQPIRAAGCNRLTCIAGMRRFGLGYSWLLDVFSLASGIFVFP